MPTFALIPAAIVAAFAIVIAKVVQKARKRDKAWLDKTER